LKYGNQVAEMIRDRGLVLDDVVMVVERADAEIALLEVSVGLEHERCRQLQATIDDLKKMLTESKS